MIEYPKIESLFRRDEKTHKLIEGEWRQPEVEYLKNCPWVCTEKVDGTNVRVMWDGKEVRFGGRTDRAQLYTPLLNKLQKMFPPEKMAEVFGDEGSVCLYGEGYGAKIQKVGTSYIPDGVDFILFDITVGEWWLKLVDVRGVAEKLGIRAVPVCYVGPLDTAIRLVSLGIESAWGAVIAEGLVCQPEVPLRCRNGRRVIVKIKTADF